MPSAIVGAAVTASDALESAASSFIIVCATSGRKSDVMNDASDLIDEEFDCEVIPVAAISLLLHTCCVDDFVTSFSEDGCVVDEMS